MMNIKFTEYKKKYLASCGKLVRESWDFESEYSDLKDPSIIYQHYILDCVNYSRHKELVIDENDNVLGILFAGLEKETFLNRLKNNLFDKYLSAKWQYHLLKGDLGDKKIAQKIANADITDQIVEAQYSKIYDGEINLFILSSTLRGKGIGFKLMNRCVDFYKNYNLNKIWLWTELSCTYSFYEKYGFIKDIDFHSPGLIYKENPKGVGMVYTLNIAQLSAF